MFLKNADPDQVKEPRPRWSITQRLVFTYTLSAFAMLAITAVFLNWTLHSFLLKAQRDYIDDRIRVYRAIIEHSPNFIYFIMQDIEWQGSFVQYPQYYSRLLNDKCHIIIETAHMNELIPINSFPDACNFKKERKNRSANVYESKNGRTFLLESFWTKAVHPAQEIAIQIAIDITAHEAIIKTNQRRMIAVIMFGIVFAILFSVVVARRVLRPLNELAETAKNITIEKISATDSDPMATPVERRDGEKQSGRLRRYYLMKGTDPQSWPVELQALASAFNDMLHRLQDSFTKLSEYTSNLAHELRTPINNMMGEAEVALSQARSAEEYRKVLESGLEENMRLSRMIDALLFLARAEHSANQIELTAFDTMEEIKRVCSFYEALAEEKQAEMNISGSGIVYGDPVLFRRVMSNLVSNAIYYAPAGVKISIDVVTDENNYTEVRVSDTGYGLTQDELHHIFNRFYRVMSSRSRNPQGSGLGLSIVKSIMDLHEGTINLQSVPGEGTTITLRFPPVPIQPKTGTISK